MPPQPSVKALLIVNPNSRQGAEEKLQEGMERLREAGIEVEQLDSGSPSESHQALQSRSQEIDLVILAGGDKTPDGHLCRRRTRQSLPRPVQILSGQVGKQLLRQAGLVDRPEVGN